jgi:hypothetical protein
MMMMMGVAAGEENKKKIIIKKNNKIIDNRIKNKLYSMRKYMLTILYKYKLAYKKKGQNELSLAAY